jgi:hypothetical protein
MTDITLAFDDAIDEETSAVALEPALVAAVNDGNLTKCRSILDHLPKKSDRVWLVNVPGSTGSTVLFTAACALLATFFDVQFAFCREQRFGTL